MIANLEVFTNVKITYVKRNFYKKSTAIHSIKATKQKPALRFL